MKRYLLLILLLASCSGNHPVDVNELKTLPDNSYAYYRGTVMVSKEKVITWYNIDDNGNIMNISKIQDNKDPKASTAHTIEKYTLDTVTEKAAAVQFTQLSHKYRFGHINVDHKNKIAYSTKQDITEEYVYPLNDSIRIYYLLDGRYDKLENGWFGYND